VTAAALLLLAAVAKPVPVTPGASPVHVDAAEVHYAFQKREVVWTGDPVTLTRDDGRLTCRKLVAKTDAAGQVQVATCTGDVKFVRGERTLTCERAIFEATTNRVTCEGNPVLREGGSEAHGSRLVYDLTADEVKLEGEPGKPVQMLVPGDDLEQRRKELAEKRKGAHR
jgi:lipopolysaccharide export system protein LptA